MAHKSDQERIEKTRNIPRFFVEHPQVSWVLLIGVLIWGWFGSAGVCVELELAHGDVL